MTTGRGGSADRFRVHQVADVVVALPDGTAFQGSGYQITADTVLTAAHVIKDAFLIGVRLDADQPDEWKAAARVTWSGVNRDLALLTLARERPMPVVAAEFVRVGDGRDEFRVHAAGWPRFKVVEREGGGTYRDLHDANGTVAPLSNRRSGTLEISVRAPAPHPDGGSPWRGMSGAAVWAGGRIVGVVMRHDMSHGLDRLTGVRIDLALADAVDANGRRLSDVLGIEAAALPVVAGDADEPPAAGRAPASLRAYRVPVDWRPDGDPCPIGDTHVADLGALLCLDRGPSTTVVAAFPGTALAEALTAVEQGPIRRGRVAAPDLPERVWRADELDPPSPPAGAAAPGVVVRRPVGVYPGGLPAGWSVPEIRDRIRASAPGAPVVVLVESAHAIDAIAAAADIARGLGGPAEAYSLVHPGDVPPPATDPAELPDRLGPDRLMATVAAEMHARGLPPTAYPFGEPLPAGADPIAVAADVVEALNRESAWGPPEWEAHAIGLVRDYAPTYFPPLLRRHADHRDGPARWASLAAAVPIDDHVTAWLDAAGNPGTPDDVPRSLRDGTLIESVLLGLLRTGRGETGAVARAWIEAARVRCPAVYAVAAFLNAGRPVEEFLPTAGAEAAIAAARAGQYHLLTADIPDPEAAEGWWAALARRPLTERTVARLAALSAESRRIAGFTADPAEPDPDFAELTYQMRAAMRPPLPVRGSTR